MKKTIFVDMDNTLNKLWVPFTDHLSLIFNQDMRIGRDQLYVYGITDNFPNIIPQAQGNQIRNDIFTTPGFWENIPIYEDAARVMAELVDVYDVYILTQPWIHYDKCVHEKYEWIKNHLPFFDLSKVIFTANKHLIVGDYFIDDAPNHLEEITHGEKIAYAYPYNKECKADHRVYSWKDIGKFFNVWHK